ncbi:MAG: DNA polymerase I [Parcubacteria group bacterium Gr01-1014_33]|nr:MAG: DNA polymerase I [Parcubacteria group bacterium Gr01-1014_33]
MKKVILIDAHALIHRAYHALPPLTSAGGEMVNAVYGFTSILLRIIRELKPDYIAAAFDLPGPTFRHLAYEDYKATRPKAPDDLISQFAKVKEMTAAFQIPIFEKEGYEADDVIGTLVKKLEREKDTETIIITGDMDALQLVGPRVHVYTMKKGITETAIYDEPAVRARYGLTPSQIADLKAFKGDASDNIKGVKGIGEKTAADLVSRFGSVEGVYAALQRGANDISESVAEKLRAGEKDAFFSKELATIHSGVPLDFSLTAIEWKNGSATEEVRTILQKFGFTSLLKRVEAGGDAGSRPAQKKAKNKATSLENAQGSLLDVAVAASPSRTVLKTMSDVARVIADKKGKEWGLILSSPDSLLLISQKGEAAEIGRALFKEKKVKKFLEENSFAVHDGKTIIHFLRKFEIQLEEIAFDSMIAGHLTSETTLRDFSYKGIIESARAGSFSAGAGDAFSRFFELKKSVEAKIALFNLHRVYYKIELPLIRILADMEERGILIDAPFLKKLSRVLEKGLAALTQEIYSLAGEQFNINSSQQLSRILFDILQLKTRGLRKTEKGGVVSTRESELEKLKNSHPIIVPILKYRELTKLKTTYVDVLPELADSKTGRLHTTFNQIGASTGRLSSSDPNLQNIPILSEYGREVRKAFIAEKGFLLVSCDYSQIELRVAAHIAHDEKMIHAFQNGMDIHKMTAAEVYNVSLDKVTPELRRAAKTLNFGVLYGMGPHAFAESTGLSMTDAKKFIDEYFRDFSGIRAYIENTKQFARENGYVETLFGRRRYIPEILSPNWQIKREAERMAVNMPIQGTATGDIVKMAMVAVDKWIRKEKLSKNVRMLLQVHDELLFEIKEPLAERVVPKIKEIMEGVNKLKVPLVVDVKMGKSWDK